MNARGAFWRLEKNFFGKNIRLITAALALASMARLGGGGSAASETEAAFDRQRFCSALSCFFLLLAWIDGIWLLLRCSSSSLRSALTRDQHAENSLPHLQLNLLLLKLKLDGDILVVVVSIRSTEASAQVQAAAAVLTEEGAKNGWSICHIGLHSLSLFLLTSLSWAFFAPI